MIYDKVKKVVTDEECVNIFGYVSHYKMKVVSNFNEKLVTGYMTTI